MFYLDVKYIFDNLEKEDIYKTASFGLILKAPYVL